MNGAVGGVGGPKSGDFRAVGPFELLRAARRHSHQKFARDKWLICLGQSRVPIVSIFCAQLERIDRGEDPWPAALRELHEETNISSVQRLGEVAEWLTYDIPRELVGQAWNGKYRGQKQKWFALRFTGDESEIDIAHPAGGHEPEFMDSRWEKLQNLPDLVVPFKRKTYERVVAEFKRFAAPQS